MKEAKLKILEDLQRLMDDRTVEKLSMGSKKPSRIDGRPCTKCGEIHKTMEDGEKEPCASCEEGIEVEKPEPEFNEKNERTNDMTESDLEDLMRLYEGV